MNKVNQCTNVKMYRLQIAKKISRTLLILLLICITSFLNQEITRLLQGSGPTRNILEWSFIPNVIAPL